jgi:ABC-2 type transport system ATP-binding protein
MKLEIKNVTKKFKEKTAVNNFSMELQSGECVGLIGPNGAGKSTLIKVIADIIDPSTGEVLLDGKKISKMKKEIGYLPQYPNFFQWMTAKETLTFMGQLSGIKREELLNGIPEILSKVGLSGEENSKVRTFSGGMKQRLGIAQAIIHRPQLVMLDEPVSALDPFGRREVLELLEGLKKETTILFSTHILNDAEEVCDEILFLHNGEIVESGTMGALRERHQQAKIDLIFRKKTEEMESTLKNHSLTQSILVDGNRISVFVTNVELARREFLKLIFEKDWPLDRFEMSSMSLEDVFMKVVGK